MNLQPPACHCCGATTLHEIEAYRRLNRVTSDCKAWSPGGRFAVCSACGFPQTVTDSAWHAEIARIYGGYTIYFQGAGAEQCVFDPKTGKPSLRSDLLLERVGASTTLPTTGRLLDIGCGNGNFMRAFAKVLPAWSLDGNEWDEKYLSEYRAISSFRQLHTGALMNIRETYQFVSIIHCLEHVPNPAAMLRQIHRLVAADGLLLIQVPDCAANPFMLTVADHCSHFSVLDLNAMVSACGYDVVHAVNHWISKEITVLARPKSPVAYSQAQFDPKHAQQLVNYIHWLAATADHARQCASEANNRIGVFGTAIAGTWLHGELGDTVAFFVDEDPNRIGIRYMGLPVVSPQQVSANDKVYIGLPPALATTVRARLGPLSSQWHLPPAL